MKKCKDCKELREYWYGESNGRLLEYCGFIEEICESAIDINMMKECPKQKIIDKYSNKVKIN
jgi:hypothetical protein